MAFSFNGSNQSISATGAPVLDVPATLCCQVYPNNITSDSFILNVGASNSNAYIGISLEGTSTGDPVAATYRSAAAVSGSAQKTGFVANAWQNVAGIFSAVNSRIVYLDALASSANTVNVPDLGTMALLGIGFLNRQTPALWSNSRIACAAMWSVVLTDDEITSLSKGFSPRRIRPQSLVFYAPLIRNLTDIKGALTLTNNNSATVADHPRVY